MSNLQKIYPGEIEMGMKFSSPVFFDDSVNMFLAAGKSVKKYHIDALRRWNIPYVVTYGHKLVDSEENFNDVDSAEFLEPLDEAGELEEIDGLDPVN